MSFTLANIFYLGIYTYPVSNLATGGAPACWQTLTLWQTVRQLCPACLQCLAMVEEVATASALIHYPRLARFNNLLTLQLSSSCQLPAISSCELVPDQRANCYKLRPDSYQLPASSCLTLGHSSSNCLPCQCDVLHWINDTSRALDTCSRYSPVVH